MEQNSKSLLIFYLGLALFFLGGICAITTLIFYKIPDLIMISIWFILFLGGNLICHVLSKNEIFIKKKN